MRGLITVDVVQMLPRVRQRGRRKQGRNPSSQKSPRLSDRVERLTNGERAEDLHTTGVSAVQLSTSGRERACQGKRLEPSGFTEERNGWSNTSKDHAAETPRVSTWRGGDVSRQNFRPTENNL